MEVSGPPPLPPAVSPDDSVSIWSAASEPPVPESLATIPATTSTSTATPAGKSSRFTLPDTSNGITLVIRTDFSNDTVWKAVVAEASKDQPMFGLPASPENVYPNPGIHPVDDRRFEGMTMAQLLQVAPDPPMPSDDELTHPRNPPDVTPLHAYLADSTTMSNPKHPLLAVNFFLDRGQHFRLLPREMAAVECNLSIANLDFGDYIRSAGPDGIVSDF